jgi:hypothetical protein
MPSPALLEAPFLLDGLGGDLALSTAVAGREDPVVVVAFLIPRGALAAGSLRGAAELRTFLASTLLPAADIVSTGELGTVRACSMASGGAASVLDASDAFLEARDIGISLRRRLVLLTFGSSLFVLEGTPRATALEEVSSCPLHGNRAHTLSEEMVSLPMVLLRLVVVFSVLGSGGAGLARLSRRDMRDVGREAGAGAGAGGGLGSMPISID